MTTSPSALRRTILLAKRTTTLGFLLAAPFALMAQHAPFAEPTAETNVPTWTVEMAEDFPGCQRHREGTVSAAVIVVDSGADVRRMSVDRAFALNTDDERANNVWVVGSCA